MRGRSNLNGGRLLVLLRWPNEAKPDVICLQELKAIQKNSMAGNIRCRLSCHLTWTKKRMVLPYSCITKSPFYDSTAII